MNFQQSSFRLLRHALHPNLQQHLARVLGDGGPRSAAGSPRGDQPNVVLTRYMEMLLELDIIPTIQNALAALSTWILLAGYIVFPGTFTSLKDSKAMEDAAHHGSAGRHVVDTVKNVPLLWLAAICCLAGTLGMAWLWWRWRGNYIWLINRIFFVASRPGLLNSVAGLLTTLIGVYSAQGGSWSVTATITGIVTGTCAAVMVSLFLLYNYWLLPQVKRDHEQHMKPE